MKRLTAGTVLFVFALVLLGCGKADTDALTSGDKERITQEIRERLSRYVEDCKALDFERIMSFWSDSEAFVFAGDGKILGGSEAWAASVKQFVENTESIPRWEWKNIHVIVLSKEIAVSTVEFDIINKLRSGKTQKRAGAWTYVFQNEDSVWRVIATNGTHLDQAD